MLSSAIMIFCYSCSMDQLWRGAQGFKKQKAFKIIMAAVVVFFLCWKLYNITRWKRFIFDTSNKACSVTASDSVCLRGCGIPVSAPEHSQVSVFWSIWPPIPFLDVKQILSSLQNGHEWTRSQKHQHIHCMFVYFLCYITWKKKWLLCFLYVTLHLLAV